MAHHLGAAAHAHPAAAVALLEQVVHPLGGAAFAEALSVRGFELAHDATAAGIGRDDGTWPSWRLKARIWGAS